MKYPEYKKPTDIESWTEATRQFQEYAVSTFGYKNELGNLDGRWTARPKAPLTLYRGATAETARGLWWTNTLYRAENYARSRSLEGLESRVFSALVQPQHIIQMQRHFPGFLEFYVHPDGLPMDNLTEEAHRGRRIPGREIEQTKRWLDYQHWMLGRMGQRYGNGLFPGTHRPNLPPAPITVHRGATPLTWDGPRWTEDRAEAEHLAKHCSAEGWDGHLYSATVPPSALFHLSPGGPHVRPHALEDLHVDSEPMPA